MVFTAAFKSVLPTEIDVGSSLRVLVVTACSTVVVMLALKLAQVIRHKLVMEKALSAFPMAPGKHWLLGHLPKVSAKLDMEVL